MGRVSFSSARTGRRPSRGGGSIGQLEYKIGERKRLVFPVVDGGLVLFAKPYHKVLNKSVQLARSNGKGTYDVKQIRCMHPYSQTTPEESLSAAKQGEICIFCDIAKYEQRRRWKTIHDEFGEDGFSELSKKDQKAYFQDLQETETVEASYYMAEDEDGNKESRTLTQIYILALELKLDSKGKPTLTADGVPEYEPRIMTASKTRLDKFKQGVDNALESGAVEVDDLYVFIENEGTDDEEEVLVGFVDFLVTFPKADDKMSSGRNMSATPVSASNSVDMELLIEDFRKKEKDLVTQAENLVDNMFVNLKPHTREAAMEMLAVEEGYIEELEAEFRLHGGEDEDGRELPNDDEKDKEILEKVLSYEKDSEKESDEEEEDKPKKSEKGKADKKGKTGEKRSKPSRQEEDDEDSDLEEDVEEKPKKSGKKDKTGKGKSSKDKASKKDKEGKRKKSEEPKEELDDDDFDDDIFDN